MKGLRLKAACAVALMLLSLVVNANAYASGKDRWWTRVSERLHGVVANKLPPSLAKKIITGVAAASLVCGAYVCGSAIFSGERPQPIKKSVDFTESLLDRGAAVIIGQDVDVAELQNAIEQLQSNTNTLDVRVVGEKTLLRLQNLLERERLNQESGRDIVWLELSDNELQAFSYDHTREREIDLSRAVFYLAVGLAGTALMAYPFYLQLSGRDYPEYFPHPYIVGLMWGGGLLLLMGGFVKSMANFGL